MVESPTIVRRICNLDFNRYSFVSDFLGVPDPFWSGVEFNQHVPSSELQLNIFNFFNLVSYILVPIAALSSVEEIAKSLDEGTSSGALLDSYVAGFYQERFKNFRLNGLQDDFFNYGFVLMPSVLKYDQCFTNYLASRQDELFSIVSENIIPLKVSIFAFLMIIIAINNTSLVWYKRAYLRKGGYIWYDWVETPTYICHHLLLKFSYICLSGSVHLLLQQETKPFVIWFMILVSYLIFEINFNKIDWFWRKIMSS